MTENSDASLAGKRCLVLDDEFLIVLDIQQILETAAAETICVGDAQGAMDALDRDGRFNVAIIDVKLDGSGQTSLAVAMRLTELGIPFVILTGMRSDDRHVGRFPDAPVVAKPYEAPRLLNAVMRAIAGNR